MNRTAVFCFATAIVVFGLIHEAHPAAAFSRYIQATGTSIGPGTVSITIESFGLQANSSRSHPVITSFNANVPIPNSSTPANSANLIRLGLIGVLPGDYTVTNPIGHPDLVQIFRTTGAFTMVITEDVPGQTIAEASIYLPGLAPWGVGVLGALLLAAGALAMFRRARRASL